MFFSDWNIPKYFRRQSVRNLVGNNIGLFESSSYMFWQTNCFHLVFNAFQNACLNINVFPYEALTKEKQVYIYFIYNQCTFYVCEYSNLLITLLDKDTVQ